MQDNLSLQFAPSIHHILQFPSFSIFPLSLWTPTNSPYISLFYQSFELELSFPFSSCSYFDCDAAPILLSYSHLYSYLNLFMMWFRIVFKILAMYKSYNCLVMFCAESRRTVPAHRLFLIESWRPSGFQHTTPCFCLMFYVLYVIPMENKFLYYIMDNKILNLELDPSIRNVWNRTIWGRVSPPSWIKHSVCIYVECTLSLMVLWDRYVTFYTFLLLSTP